MPLHICLQSKVLTIKRLLTYRQWKEQKKSCLLALISNPLYWGILSVDHYIMDNQNSEGPRIRSNYLQKVAFNDTLCVWPPLRVQFQYGMMSLQHNFCSSPDSTCYDGISTCSLSTSDSEIQVSPSHLSRDWWLLLFEVESSIFLLHEELPTAVAQELVESDLYFKRWRLELPVKFLSWANVKSKWSSQFWTMLDCGDASEIGKCSVSSTQTNLALKG